MSREKGSVYFSAGFETKKVIPLDARQLVGTYADLTLPATWEDDDNLSWLYAGAIVAVSSDGDSSKNGIYWLCATDYTVSSNWVKVGEGTGTITGGTNGLGTDGANIVLGGDLTSGATINGQGLYDINFSNVDGFNVSTSGNTTEIILEPAGITLAYSGTTVSLDTTEGLIYGDAYTSSNPLWIPTKAYVDGVAIGLNVENSVLVATTGETIDLSTGGLLTVDGIVLSDGDRVLVKSQTDASENGIYIASASTWVRSSDYNFDPPNEIANGDLIPVITGTTQFNSLWALTSPNPVESGDTLTFTLFQMPTKFNEGVGIDISGNTISVDGASLEGTGVLWTGDTFNVDGSALVGNGIIWSGDTFNIDGTTLAGDHIEWDGTQFNVIPSGITSGYTTLSQFNTYSGDTEIRLTTIEDDIIYISGITDTKLDIDIFTGYTASTETRLTGIEDDIDYLSGVTENKLDTSVYTGYTATTEVRLTDIENDIDYISGQTLTISIFTGYTAITETRLTDIENDIQYISGITDNKLDTSIFAAYTGTTQPILNAALSGATNGLTATGRVVKLGSALTENTTINLSTFSLTFSDNPIEYAADYSADYNARSIPDVDFVTGYTQSAVTQSSNVLNIVDFTGTGYTATTESDFIGASGGTTIFLPNPPKDGQRIVVADIGGNALMSPIKIDGNGKEILKSTDQATINTEFGSITFIYNSKGFWSTAAFIN